MSKDYRYTGGNEVAVVLVDGIAFPVDPSRVYDADDLIVVSRPDLFTAASSAPAVIEDASADPGAKRTRTAQRG